MSQNRLRYLGQQSIETHGSGVVDPIAFRATGLAQMTAHLDAHGIEYTHRQASEQEQFQLFFMDPDGLKIELGFAASEAEAITADVVAADLPGDNG